MTNDVTNSNGRVTVDEVIHRDSVFRYQLLDRLRSDCEYYLNYGNRHPKTFFEYSDIRQARKTIPVLNMITTPAAELKDKAERLAGEIRRTTHNFTVEVEACKDQVGGGSAPTVLLDGYAVAVQGRTLAPEKIERLLRKEEIPIIIRITHNQVYLDVRTIREDEFEYIVAAFTAMDSRQVEG